MTEPRWDDETAERGAAEERSGAPVTPTEEEGSRGTPGDSGPGAGLDGGGRYGDDG